LRLPRALGAIVAGMGLAVSGAILQTVTNNGLAGPNIIGVNAGAGLGIVLISVFLPFNFYLTPLAAFLGALLTTLLIAFVYILHLFHQFHLKEDIFYFLFSILDYQINVNVFYYKQ
jgi:ABC-type Fe3+-siderophore transport system permease subunit